MADDPRGPDSPDENTPIPPGEGPEISAINIEDEVRSSFLAYSMSVIISRALPSVRDGIARGAKPDTACFATVG